MAGMANEVVSSSLPLDSDAALPLAEGKTALVDDELSAAADELAETCLSKLHRSGYPQANEVGRVSKLHGKSSSIILK